MRVLSVGTFQKLSNTCLHRHWALKNIADKVDEVDTSADGVSWAFRIAYHMFLYGLPVPVPERQDENRRIRALVDANDYDVVWIDKGITIRASTLRYIRQRQPHALIISYSPDNMVLRHNQSKQFLDSISLYDYHVTTKSYILDDLRRLGARHVIFVNKAYAPEFHHPCELTAEERERLGGDVGFIGTWERERCDSLLYLAAHGIRVKVFGDGMWNNYRGTANMEIVPAVFSEDYSKALQAFKISMCFLRKMNADQQTSRTMEIPACGGFMMAERTVEHQRLFREDEEAVFFGSNEELLEKVCYYLSHDDERYRIAAAGLRRCETSGYSNEGMIRNVLGQLLK